MRLPLQLRRLADEALAAPDLATLKAAMRGMTSVLGNRRAQVLVLGNRPRDGAWPADGVRALALWEPDARHAIDLDRPEAVASALAPQADAAIIDTRLLLATRLLRRRRTWPSAEDRFASDLLQPDIVADPWLRELTRSAADSGLPILLGGPSLIDWGVRQLLTSRPHDPLAT
jgi:hypothetical protein